MNNFAIGLLCVGLLFSSSNYYGSTTAPVTIAGGIIKAKHTAENTQKYKRKDCPVCKGKGWYMSGDNIKKIDCTYCEPNNSSISIGPIQSLTPAPAPPAKPCINGKCPLPNSSRK